MTWLIVGMAVFGEATLALLAWVSETAGIKP